MTVVERLQSSGIRRLGSPKRGFRYRRSDGGRVSREERARIAALVLPPAWTDVYVSPSAVVRRTGDRPRPRGPMAVRVFREADAAPRGAQARAPPCVPPRAARAAHASRPGPAAGRLVARACPRGDGPAAPARIPPAGKPGLRAGERLLRPRHASSQTRSRPRLSRHARLPGQRRQAPAAGDRRRGRRARRARAPRRSGSRGVPLSQRRRCLGERAAEKPQRVSRRNHRRPRHRQGLPDLGRNAVRRLRARPRGLSRPSLGAGPPIGASRRRCARPRSSSGTRRRSAGRPTSAPESSKRSSSGRLLADPPSLEHLVRASPRVLADVEKRLARLIANGSG